MTTTRYCRACEQSFSEATSGSVCPQCGSDLDELDHASTVALDIHTAQTMSGMASIAEQPMDKELVGRELATYRIERYLGRGGMARVYLATHLTLHRPCAVKLFRPSKVNRTADPVASFLAEARAAAALVHPHVVTIHTIGTEQDQHFIEMEYVAGQSLARLLQNESELDVQRATNYMIQISSALAAAHEMGMIHRDIKPANVMLSASDQAKLADFGLAKRLSSTPREQDQRELLCGTPNYMAPELFAGAPASKQSDIYAMGVTYFSLLTGRTPIDLRSITELMQLHAQQSPIDLDCLEGTMPDVVVDILRRCLAYDPADRFHDAEELLRALRNAFGSLRSLRSLLDEAGFEQEVAMEGDKSEFVLKVPLADQRSQLVRVEESRDAETHEPIIRIMSVCGSATGAYYEHALQLNADISHGSLAITEVDGEPYFVMMRAYPRATCDPEEIYKSVHSIARHSDAIEWKLTGNNRF